MMLGRDYDKCLVKQGISLLPRPRGTKLISKGFAWAEIKESGRITSLNETAKWLDVDRAAISGISDLVVFDWDNPEDRLKFWDSKIIESLPNETLLVKSKRGCAEWFFDHDAKEAAKEVLGFLPDKIDFRPCMEFEIFIDGHLASCPGNLHEDQSTIYKALGTLRIKRKDGIVKQALDRMIDSFKWQRRPSKKFDKLILRNGVPEGQRHNVGIRLACFLLKEFQLDFNAAWAVLERWNQLNRPPLPERELESIAESAVSFVTAHRRPSLTQVNGEVIR